MFALWAHDTRLGRAAVVSLLVDVDAMTNDLGPADVLTPTELVRVELRAQPGRYLTTAKLADLTGLSVLQVRSAIYVLSKQHNLLRRATDNEVRRTPGQAYAWNFRGVS